MFIQTEATPNPATLKFIPGKPVLDQGTLEFRDPSARQGLAARGAAVRDRRRQGRVLRLRLHQRDQGRRRVAASEARHPRRHHGALPVGRGGRRDGEQTGSESSAEGEFYAPEDEETVKTIKELLETRVRPPWPRTAATSPSRAIARASSILHMRGACSGCPSSTATLRHGIENLLRHFIPEVQEVRPV